MSIKLKQITYLNFTVPLHSVFSTHNHLCSVHTFTMFKGFHKSVTLELCIFMTELQLTCCHHFIVECILISSRPFLQFGKETNIWQWKKVLWNGWS